MRAMGEHKGSGLALMCELLAGALTGSGCSGPGEKRIANGMLSIYISPKIIGSSDEIAAEAMRYVDWVKSTRPVPNNPEVLVPGEPERRTKAKRLSEGVPLTAAAWDSLREAARDVGVDPDAYFNRA
jgi:uncharacterized oxidoreductase